MPSLVGPSTSTPFSERVPHVPSACLTAASTLVPKTFPQYQDQLDALARSVWIYVKSEFLRSRGGPARFLALARAENCAGPRQVQETPCGFAFVQFTCHEDAILADMLLNGTTFQGRKIRVEIDWGFSKGDSTAASMAAGERRISHGLRRGPGWPRRSDGKGLRG